MLRCCVAWYGMAHRARRWQRSACVTFPPPLPTSPPCWRHLHLTAAGHSERSCSRLVRCPVLLSVSLSWIVFHGRNGLNLSKTGQVRDSDSFRLVLDGLCLLRVMQTGLPAGGTGRSLRAARRGRCNGWWAGGRGGASRGALAARVDTCAVRALHTHCAAQPGRGG